MSGSPVWRFGALECDWNYDAWSANLCSLAGIVTDWNEGHQILIVTPFLEIMKRLVAPRGTSRNRDAASY